VSCCAMAKTEEPASPNLDSVALTAAVAAIFERDGYHWAGAGSARTPPTMIWDPVRESMSGEVMSSGDEIKGRIWIGNLDAALNPDFLRTAKASPTHSDNQGRPQTTASSFDTPPSPMILNMR